MKGESNWPRPQEKLPSKSPALLGLNDLNHFTPMFHLYTPWKSKKTGGFVMFSGGTAHWHGIG